MKHLPTLDLRPPPSPTASTSANLPAPPYAVEDASERIVTECTRLIVFRPDDGSAPTSARVPTTAERDVLEQRKARIAASLRGCAARNAPEADRRKAASAISELLGSYLRGRNIDDKAKMLMGADVLQDVAPLPAWAVARACDRLRRGEVPGLSKTWIPTGPEFFALVKEELAPALDEQRRIEETLRLKPREIVDDAARQRVGEKFNDLRRTLHAMNDSADKPAPPPVLTEAEMHAKYADANRRLREIYGTTNKGIEHAD